MIRAAKVAYDTPRPAEAGAGGVVGSVGGLSFQVDSKLKQRLW